MENVSKSLQSAVMQLFLRRTMRVLKVGGLSALSGALILASAFPACAATQTLLSHTVHLGLAGKPEWDVFAGMKPDGTNLLLKFSGHVNACERPKPSTIK
jgi:hypothetical protein